MLDTVEQPTNSTKYAKGHPPSNTDRNQTPLEELAELQRLLMKKAREEDCPAAALAQVARAHVDAERMQREIRMQPKAKPVDVSPEALAKRSKRKPAQTDVDPSA